MISNVPVINPIRIRINPNPISNNGANKSRGFTPPTLEGSGCMPARSVTTVLIHRNGYVYAAFKGWMIGKKNKYEGLGKLSR